MISSYCFSRDLRQFHCPYRNFELSLNKRILQILQRHICIDIILGDALL